MRVRMKLWLEADGKVLFGHGRLQLLQAIGETGSLAGAAKVMDMSYRAAWGRLKASEDRLGLALVEPGGRGRRTSDLTAQALDILRWYQELEAKAEEFLARAETSRPACLKE
jgi:molybdate transport system regulatory protein